MFKSVFLYGKIILKMKSKTEPSLPEHKKNKEFKFPRPQTIFLGHRLLFFKDFLIIPSLTEKQSPLFSVEEVILRSKYFKYSHMIRHDQHKVPLELDG